MALGVGLGGGAGEWNVQFITLALDDKIESGQLED